MTTTYTIQMLMRYNAWANKAIFEAVAALPGSEATKERPTLFKNIVNTLNHLHVVDLIWQAHIEKRDHGIPALNTVLYTDLTELWRAQQAIDAWYIAWGDTLSEADADAPVRFTLIGGKQGEMRRSEISQSTRLSIRAVGAVDPVAPQRPHRRSLRSPEFHRRPRTGISLKRNPAPPATSPSCGQQPLHHPGGTIPRPVIISALPTSRMASAMPPPPNGGLSWMRRRPMRRGRISCARH